MLSRPRTGPELTSVTWWVRFVPLTSLRQLQAILFYVCLKYSASKTQMKHLFVNLRGGLISSEKVPSVAALEDPAQQITLTGWLDLFYIAVD